MKADIDTYSEFEKRRILSVIGDGRDLMEIASAKIYTSSKEGASWLYSDLEGFFCYLIDYNQKVQLLVLYDFTTYEKLFQFELYLDFPKYYSILSTDFHCFETDSGFIGLKFLNSSEAEVFSNRINKYDSMNQSFKKSLNNRRRDKYKIGRENVILLKEKFKEDEPYLDINNYANESDEQIFEDGIEINKPSYYHFLNSITYDPYKRVFRLYDVSPDLKNLFNFCGLKKSDFKNESLALYTFKHLALCYDALETKKKEKRKLLKNDLNGTQFNSILEEDIEEIDLILKKSLSAFEEEKIKETAKFKSMKSSFIPSVPKLPALPKIIPINKTDLDANLNINNQIDTRSATFSNNFDTDLSKIKLKPVNSVLIQTPDDKSENKRDNSSYISSGTNNSILDEIRKGVQLKKINLVPKEEEKRPLKINKDDRGFLQTALQKAIQQRREELTKNDISDDESNSESDWSD
jgi:hypothetical protein